MCVATYEAMIEVKCRSKAARSVLSYLAWTKNHLTAMCFPKPQKIAERTQLSLSGVYAALVELREDGLIVDTMVRFGRRELAGFRIVHPTEGEITAGASIRFVFNIHGPIDDADFPATGRPIPAAGIAYKKLKPEPEPDAESMKREAAENLPPTPPQSRTFVPDNLSEEMRDHASEEGFSDYDVVHEHKTFVNWHRAKGVKSHDWRAAWAVWLQRAAAYRRRVAVNAKRESGARASKADAVRAAAAALAEQNVLARDWPSDAGDQGGMGMRTIPPF